MANNTTVLAGFGLAALGIFGLTRLLRQAPEGDAAIALRGGSFSIQGQRSMAPDAIVFDGQSHPSAVVSYYGELMNNGNIAFEGHALLVVYSNAAAVRTSAVAVSVPAGTFREFELQADVLETDPPGDIIATIEIYDLASVRQVGEISSVLGVIEELAVSLAMTGDFGIHTPGAP